MSRESTAATAGSAPPLRRGALGRELVHVKDTPQHSLSCCCLSCGGWQPPEEVLPSRETPEEAFVFVVARKVPSKSGEASPNTKWICMGCGVTYVSSVTRMREHRVGSNGRPSIKARPGRALFQELLEGSLPLTTPSGLPLRHPRSARAAGAQHGKAAATRRRRRAWRQSASGATKRSALRSH